MALKLKEVIPADESGYSLEYQVWNGSFWIAFKNPDGFGNSWIIGEESNVSEFITACYSIKAKKKISLTAQDDLNRDETHKFLFELQEEDVIKLTHKKEGGDDSNSWFRMLNYQQLTDIAMSLEQYFDPN